MVSLQEGKVLIAIHHYLSIKSPEFKLLSIINTMQENMKEHKNIC